MDKFTLFMFVFFVAFITIIYFGTPTKPYYSVREDCGKRHPQNVSTMRVNLWPWQVSVQYRPNSSAPFSQICEGIIIHKHWIITTATCTYVDKSNLLVRAGSTRLDVDDEFTQQLEVARMIRHKQFNPVTLRYSVALLEVKTPFEFNDHVNRICVPDNTAAYHKYVSCHVTGYNTHPGDQFGVLQGTEVQVMSRPLCNKMKIWDSSVPADLLCVTKFNEDVDRCQTNFGGPLNCYIAVLQSYYLIGIRVMTDSCDEPDQPMVYFKVSSLYYWLEHVMNISLH